MNTAKHLQLVRPPEQPLGYVTAVVRFPLFAGDAFTSIAADNGYFEYAAPCLTPVGVLGEVRRGCTVIDERVDWEERREKDAACVGRVAGRPKGGNSRPTRMKVTSV